MFKRDQKAVQAWTRNPDRLLDVIAMVLLSIRQPWYLTGKQLADVRAKGAKSSNLWGSKKPGYIYAVEFKAKLYAKVRDYRAKRCTAVELMREIMKVPGLGLAKAGFVVQLVAGDIGCMDSHNIKRFGLDAKFFRLPKLKNPARQIAAVDDKIAAYIALCDAAGGCEFLWNSWCDLMAERAPYGYESGDHASKMHIDFLK